MRSPDWVGTPPVNASNTSDTPTTHMSTSGELPGLHGSAEAQPLLRPRVAVVGQTWELQTVHTFVGIATGLGKSYPWDDAKSGVGFRLVLEPR